MAASAHAPNCARIMHLLRKKEANMQILASGFPSLHWTFLTRRDLKTYSAPRSELWRDWAVVHQVTERPTLPGWLSLSSEIFNGAMSFSNEL